MTDALAKAAAALVAEDQLTTVQMLKALLSERPTPSKATKAKKGADE